MALHLDRLDGERLVLDGHGIARGFFVGDPSSIAEGSYDSLAGTGARDQISTADITAINRTMRARSGHKHWAAIVDRDLPWLAAIDPELDLIEADDERWDAAGGDRLAAAALAATCWPLPWPVRGDQGAAPETPTVLPGAR